MSLRALLLLTALTGTLALFAQNKKSGANERFPYSFVHQNKVNPDQPYRNAFDHLLQRPRVSKRFEDKKFFDHFFIETSLGGNIVSMRRDLMGSISPNMGVAVGDWLTPEHGFRVGFNVMQNKFVRRNNAAFAFSADYMMNITALAQPTFKDPHYDKLRRFEVYGIAGLTAYSGISTAKKMAFGAQLGLRGQVNLPRYTYAFLEARGNIVSQNALSVDTWRKYRPGATLMVGAGYRMHNEKPSSEDYDNDGHLLSDAFLSVYGAPMFFAQGSPSNWGNYSGARAGVYIGRWIRPHSGVRLGLGAMFCEQPGYEKMKGGVVSLGYLWNMHNTFAGYKSDRIFWVNGVADLNLSMTNSSAGTEVTPGIGAGLQANVRLGKGVEFFVEPRWDIHTEKYAAHLSTYKKLDATFSLLAGLTFRQGIEARQNLENNSDFERKNFFSNTFIEGAFGATIPVNGYCFESPISKSNPKVYVGAGKWFTALHGARIYGEAELLAAAEGYRRTRVIGFGADYLFNITNALHGYNEDRPLELIGGAGLNFSMRSWAMKPYVGASVSLRGQWNINDTYALFLEPQARIHSHKFLPTIANSKLKRADVTAAALLGLQMKFKEYDRKGEMEVFKDRERKDFVSISGGTYSPTRGVRTRANYGVIGSLSRGRWIGPASAVRLSLTGKANPRKRYRRAEILAGADYLMDLTTLAMGYDEERITNLRTFVGFGLGAGYMRREARFESEVRVGGQLAFRAGEKYEVFVEPQVAYELNKGGRPRLKRLIPSLSIGLTRNMQDGYKRTQASPEHKRFVSIGAFGLNLSSTTLGYARPLRRKFGFSTNVAYGQWFNGRMGLRAGITNSVLRRHRDNFNITSFHVEFMENLLRKDPTEKGFQLAMFCGASLNVSSGQRGGSTFAPGLQLSLQPAYAINEQWSVFVEGQGSLLGKNIKDTRLPAHAEVRGMIGAKYNF